MCECRGEMQAAAGVAVYTSPASQINRSASYSR